MQLLKHEATYAASPGAAAPHIKDALRMYLRVAPVLDMRHAALAVRRLLDVVNRVQAERLGPTIEAARAVARDNLHLEGAQELVAAQAPRVEQRKCAACEVDKPYIDFAGKQWGKSTGRRCKDCVAQGRPCIDRAAEEARRVREEAEALAAALEATRIREREDAEREVARRNLLERPDDECAVCFDGVEPAGRTSLHGAHWVCTPCAEELRQAGVAACPFCREPID